MGPPFPAPAPYKQLDILVDRRLPAVAPANEPAQPGLTYPSPSRERIVRQPYARPGSTDRADLREVVAPSHKMVVNRIGQCTGEQEHICYHLVTAPPALHRFHPSYLVAQMLPYPGGRRIRIYGPRVVSVERNLGGQQAKRKGFRLRRTGRT